MKIPPFWCRATHPANRRPGDGGGVEACGWSFASPEDARRQAEDRARRVADLLAAGRKPGSYEYADRPVQEETIEELRVGDETIAIVTRNRYGALVLNSARVLFADVDFPAARASGLAEWFASLFQPRWRQTKAAALARETAARIESWAAANPARSFRMYRTHQGLRLLFTDRLYEPTSPETLAMLTDLKSDPMYIMLTTRQESFRARLTAKPWRCGCPRPPNSFPWVNAEAERQYRRWEKQYSDAEAPFRACELLREFGPMADLPAVRLVVAAHDKLARIDSGAPLA